MKNTHYLLTGVLLLGLSACRKEEGPTVIQGLVTNSATGEPIADALIYYNTIVKNAAPGMGWRTQTTNTDANGFYSVTVSPYYNWDLYLVSKEGYLPNVSPVMGHQFTSGEVNTLDIKMVALDGFIRLVVNNNITGHDSLYVSFFSPIQDAQFQLSGFIKPKNHPIVLTMNGVYEEVIGFPGDDLITIYWKSTNVAGAKDSVFINRYDTLTYTINF